MRRHWCCCLLPAASAEDTADDKKQNDTEFLIGQGAYGSVVKKRDEDDEKSVVAVKRVRFSAQALREVQLLRTAQGHPNIVRFRRAVVHPQEVEVVMHFEGDETLVQLLERWRPPSETRLRMQRDVTSALAYLHERHIGHFDVKLDNVAVDEAHHVRLLDFGLAHPFRDDTPLDGMRGTRAYACPEMCDERPYYATDADAWSLAVVCFAIEFGHFPFREASARCLNYWLFRKVCLRKDPCEAIAAIYPDAAWTQAVHSQLCETRRKLLSCTLRPDGERASPRDLMRDVFGASETKP